MTWTAARPTKPGRYWVSLAPHIRAELDALLGRRTRPCFIAHICDENIAFLHISGKLSLRAIADWLEGAQWLAIVEPVDPHVCYQQEEERDELLRKPRLSGADKARLRELNDALSTETPEEQRYLGILRRAAKQRESLRSRIEALPDLVLDSGRVIGGAVDRGAVLALLDEVLG